MNRWSLRLTTMVVIALVPSVVCPQSLADAAAKEKERRKRVAPAAGTKVYSESDLQGSGPAARDSATTPSDEATTRAPAASRSGQATGSTRTTEHGDEMVWRDRASRARLRIAVAEASLQKIERDANAKTAIGMPKSDCNVPASVFQEGVAALKTWRCTLSPTPTNPYPRLESARREVQSAKDAWAALEMQARHASVPAAWLR